MPRRRHIHSHGTTSAWYDDTGLALDRPVRSGPATTDVAVVGGGIAGLMSAYVMARHGRRVILVTDGALGSGETGRTSAHLSCAVDDRFDRVERMHGLEVSRIVAESHAAAIDAIEVIAREERIDCDFRRVDGHLFLPPGEDLAVLDREWEAAHRAGVSGVERLDRTPGFEGGPCLRFPGQAQFHPLRFLSGLAEAFERLGGEIRTQTRVADFTRTPTNGDRPATTDRSSAAGAPANRLVTAGGDCIDAAQVIVATNAPVNDRVAMHTKQVPHRTYAIAAPLPADAIAPALFWDTSEQAGGEHAYHYLRVHARADSTPTALLIVGGGDHPTGERVDEPQRWRRLEQWARERFAMLGPISHRWSGQVLEPHDRLAYIGADPVGPAGVFVVTGDSGMGLTHAAIAALMMPALLRGIEHPWSAAYDPSRKPTHAIGRFAEHLARMSARYADWLDPGAPVDRITAGDGRIVRRGLSLLAVHRDDGGALHVRSAVCPHLGCIVRWNAAERSWDCPCHGSRFDPDGRVLAGPALHALRARDHHELASPPSEATP